MRRSSSATRKQVATSINERSGYSSLGGAANVFLTLPSVSAKVPTVSNSTVNAECWAKIALLLLDMVDEKEIVVRKNLDPRSVIDQAISKWVSKHCGDIKVMGGFSLVATIKVEDQNVYCSNNKSDDTEKTWQLGLCSTQTEMYFEVKTKVEALEAFRPGLGHTAVHFAEAASYRTIEMFTPNVAFYHAQHVYWYGADNDEDFLSEQEYSGEEDGEGEAEVFKPSDFLKSFPDFFFSGAKLSPEQLKSIAASKDSEEGEVARIILTIDRLCEEGAKLPDLTDREIEHVYFSGAMHWDENDSLARCHDDFINMANECSDGYTDLFGVTDVPYNPKAFQKWRAEMEKGFELYSQLDRLMQLIGTVVNP